MNYGLRDAPEPVHGSGQRSGQSASAQVARSRPFYSSHAYAYDLLITDPVGPWVDLVHHELTRLSRATGSVLDAGCGTGRHATALTELGHRVTLADASPELLAIASRRCPTSPAWLVDLPSLRTDERFEAVTCRGVLNDLLSDLDRQSALEAMATCLAPGGMLICDVREASQSALRADGVPRTTIVDLPRARRGADTPRSAVDSDGATLKFTSTSNWHQDLIHVREEHLLHSAAGTECHTHDFRMRPWTSQELTARLHAAGMTEVEIRPAVGRRTPDRLLVMARRGDEDVRSERRITPRGDTGGHVVGCHR